MRELLITMTLLSLVSSEEFEPKKRFGIPPEEDPNFWPTRGRRSYWNKPRITANAIRQNLPLGPEVEYARHPRSWPSENDLSSTPEVLGYSDSWKIHLCPRRKPISLVLPLREYHPDDVEHLECGGRSNGPILGRDRRWDERWRRQQPFYVEEPGWIAINYDHGVLGRSTGAEDPFVVARGKKRNEEVFDIRERRQLEDVISSNDLDPFFVARGKRDVNFGEVLAKDEFERLSFKAESGNEMDSKLRRKRSSDLGDKKEQANSEQVSAGKENQKFFFKSTEDNKNTFLTNNGVEKDEDDTHHRLQRSSTEIFQGGENEWVKKAAVPNRDEEFSVVKPRYSRPRDKHSNLQSILDEPFFVSRGKKDKETDKDQESAIKIGEYFQSNNEGEILKNYYRDGGALGLAYEAFSDSPKTEDLELFRKILSNDLKRSDPKSRYKPPRNRRGMLDDLLKEDDPFYVARGKKIYPNSQIFDVTINDGSTANGKFSIFSKTTREKLLKKLSDYSRIRGKPYLQSQRINKEFFDSY